jgi:RP/EB family microtubule-associated protein
MQVTELKLKVDNVERERDFYFDKLRDIEILCQMPLLQSIPVSIVLVLLPAWCQRYTTLHTAI